MSSWGQQKGMGVQRILIPIALLLLASAAVLVSGQKTGFISIDCGKPKDYTHVDTTTGILYTSDFQFIDTGETHNISSNFVGTKSYTETYYDVRSFPNGSRNCYTIKAVKQGKKYLVRASFVYGDYDGLDNKPQFDLYLGVNLWNRVNIFGNYNDYSYEIIAIAPSNSMSVCLVNTGKGTPFISSLELRPIDDSLYKQVNSSQSLSLFYRLHAGTNITVRYPSDTYDRVWKGYSPSGWGTLVTTSPINTENSYDPPLEVMKTASFPKNISESLSFSWESTGNSENPSPLLHTFLHFAELQLLKPNESRIFNITVNGILWYENLSPSYLSIDTISAIKPGRYDKLYFSLVKTNGSTLPPILNAAEVYKVLEVTNSETDSTDVDAIMEIKALYNVKRNWMGDPCAPSEFIWEGLNCSYGSSKSPRIISLNLSSSGLTGEIRNFLANLTELQSLDLSRNDLTGGIPDFLASLSNLKLLNLSGNKLTGPIPKALLDRSQAGFLILSIGDSPDLCNNLDQCTEKKKSKKKLVIAIIASAAVVGLLVVGLLIVVWTLRRGRQDLDTRKMPSFHSESRQFTYTELVNVTNNFESAIGKGGFGTVYHGVLQNDLQVAVKMLSKSSSQGPKEFHTEAQLLTRIHHRNLVPLVGYCKDFSHLALVYEYMEAGSLEDHLSGKVVNSDALCWKARLQIAVEAAQGLEYLHKGCKPAIVHRDVKTSNILLCKNLEARIADFGLSKIFETDGLTHVSTVVMGTPGYLDPEYYITNKLNEKSDVYSFGIVLLELISGLPAIVKQTENIHIVQWVQPRVARGEINEIIDRRLQGDYDINTVWKAVEIALACTPQISIQRPTMSEVLMLLKECLELEMAHKNSQQSSSVNFDTKSTISLDMIPMGMTSVTNPSAR